MANAVVLNVYRDGFSHPVGAAGVLVGMVVWTFVVTWAYRSYARRTTAWVVADLGVALAALGLTALVKDPGYHSTIPGFWVIAAMFAWAIHWRALGGFVAAVLLSVTDVLTRHYVDETVYGNLFLLLIGGPIVGLMADSLMRSAARTAVADRAAAAAAERTRLARVVHDGVLQVLALVQRRGPELGPDGAELGRLAAEQEQALRALIRQQDAVGPTPGVVDLVGELSALERRAGVSVAAPSSGVLLEKAAADEVVAVVSSCLDNVVAHVGPVRPRLGAARGDARGAPGHGPGRGSGHPAGTARGGGARGPARRGLVHPWPGVRARRHRHADHRLLRHGVGAQLPALAVSPRPVTIRCTR